MNIVKRFNRIKTPLGRGGRFLPRRHLSLTRTLMAQQQPLLPPPSTTTLLKLQSVLPRITNVEELSLARELIAELTKFDSGIYIDPVTCQNLIRIIKESRQRSSEFKELINISRLRLLRILFTNKEFWSSYYLLNKDQDKEIVYPNKVPPSIIAGTLINLKRLRELRRYMYLVIKDNELPMELKTKFTRSMMRNFMHNDSIGLAFQFWYHYSMLAYGHLNFDNFIRYSDSLASLYLVLNQYDESNLIPSLVNFQKFHKLSNHHFSMFLSSCIYSLKGNNQNMNRMLSIWDYKTRENLEFVPSDLTAIMSILNRNNENDRALIFYNENPALHEDAQFDSLLRIHGSERLWQSMQQQFEALFGRGELPNITHYGIVMTALASKGELNAVKLLWDQLLSRQMIPSIPVLHSMMLVNVVVGKNRNAILWFQKMPTYGVNYTRQSYNLLFKLLRGLKELKIQMKFFKKLVFEEKFELNHKSFQEILMTCLEANDALTAEYVYNTLKSFGYELGDKMDAIVMNTMNNAKKYKKVENWISTKIARGEPVSSKHYNQLILRYLKTGEYANVFEIISNMRAKEIPLDNYSYSYLLTALIKSDNLEQGLQLFDDLSAQFSLSHYNEFMHALYDSPYYEKIPEIYDKMIEMNLTPDLESYQCLIKGLCKQYEVGKGDSESTVELAVKVVNTLLKDKSSEDLAMSIDNLPFSLVYRLLRLLLSYDFNLSKTLLVEFHESCGDKISLENDIRFNYISLKIYERERNDDEFLLLFTRYIKLLNSKFFINQTTEQVSKRQTPKHLRYGFADFWPNMLRIKRQRGELAQVQPLLNSLIEKGFLISNKNYNQTAVALIRSKETFEQALSLVENKLIDGYIYLRRKRKYKRLLERAGAPPSLPLTNAFQKDKFRYYLEGLGYIKMVQILDKRILPKKSDRKLQRDEMFNKLKKKYPKTLQFFQFRSKVIDKWFVLNLRFKGTKRKRFANQHERDAFRHQQRLDRILESRKRKYEQRKLERLLFKTKGSRMRRRERLGFAPRRLGYDRKKMFQEFNKEEEEDDGEPRQIVERDIPSPFVSKVGGIIGNFKDDI